MLLFQSTHLQEVRPPLQRQQFVFFRFQSTHLQEVRPIAARNPYAIEVFQSTHLQEVRRIITLSFIGFQVSFNPRTYKRCDASRLTHTSHSIMVSIHAPTRGATLHTLSYFANILFQSTHLQEVRRSFVFTLLCICFGFNPRTYKRCDRRNRQILNPDLWFQSTHLQEVRHKQSGWIIDLCGFQSTHLQEVRHYFFVKLNKACRVSIHAPTRGATII